MAELKKATKRINRIKRVLPDTVVAEKGRVACINLADGTLVPGAVNDAYFPIGWFEESFTGDGARLMSVELFAEVECVLFANASTGAVDNNDVGAMTYLHSSSEVSMTATGKSIAGRVWEVETRGVWVQPSLALGPQGIQGIQGEPG